MIKKTMLSVLFFLITSLAFANGLQKNAIHTTELTRYLENRYRGLKPKFKKRALKIIPIVIEHAIEKNLDPLLVAVLISCESNWNVEAVGSVGEQGLMQVHGMAAKGYDLTTPENQIDAGTTHFRRALDICKNVHAAIVAYATGSCNGHFPKAKRRMRLYKKAIKQFRSDK